MLLFTAECKADFKYHWRMPTFGNWSGYEICLMMKMPQMALLKNAVVIKLLKVTVAND